MEKEIAVEVIGDVLTHTRGHFLPYFQQCVEAVLALVDHHFEGVRRSAIGTLWRGYASLWAMAEDNGMAKWQSGLPLKVQASDDLMKLGSLIMTATLALWQDEVDRYVINHFPVPSTHLFHDDHSSLHPAHFDVQMCT